MAYAVLTTNTLLTYCTGYRHQELSCFQMTLAPFRPRRRLQTFTLAFIPSARSRVSDYPLAPRLPSASLMSSSAFVVNSYAIRTFPSDRIDLRWHRISSYQPPLLHLNCLADFAASSVEPFVSPKTPTPRPVGTGYRPGSGRWRQSALYSFRPAPQRVRTW